MTTPQLPPDASWHTADHELLRVLAQRARWAVFAAICHRPAVEPPELRRLVRVKFEERGIPIDGHNLSRTLHQLVRTGQVEQIGSPSRPLYVVAPDVEAAYVERIFRNEAS